MLGQLNKKHIEHLAKWLIHIRKAADDKKNGDNVLNIFPTDCLMFNFKIFFLQKLNYFYW